MMEQLPLADFVHLRGIEREVLRITQSGNIAQTQHPSAFGSKLNNKTITVDFSESQLELITKPHDTVSNTLKSLSEISSFCAQNMLRNELLLNSSMPLNITESEIHIANFGSSHLGQMQRIYRQGLALRYGKMMQVISGIHYNFSFDPKLMTYISKIRGIEINSLYFSVINHYFDFMFLLPYLFGASPICSKTLVTGKDAKYLDKLDNNYYFGEYATSLRMSEFGYQNSAQKHLLISHLNLSNYVKDLIKATDTPHHHFSILGKYDGQGHQQQLNCNALQIENEYYAAIRPKQISKVKERPAHALLQQGVGYLELRLLDINPFFNIGIDFSTSYFIEALLMTCLMLPPKKYYKKAMRRNQENLNKVVMEGRNPKLLVMTDNHHSRKFQEVGFHMLDLIEKYSRTMGSSYLEAIDLQRKKLENVQDTPSAQILSKSCTSYQDWFMKESQKHHKSLIAYKIPKTAYLYLQNEAKESQMLQKNLEQKDSNDLETYIKKYYSSNF